MGVSVDVSLLCVTDTLVRLNASDPERDWKWPRMRDRILFVDVSTLVGTDMNLRV